MTSLAAFDKLQDVTEYCTTVYKQILQPAQNRINPPRFDTRSSFMTHRMSAAILNSSGAAWSHQSVGFLFCCLEMACANIFKIYPRLVPTVVTLHFDWKWRHWLLSIIHKLHLGVCPVGVAISRKLLKIKTV